MFEFGDQFSGRIAPRQLEAHLSDALAPRGTVTAQLLEPAHPTLVAGAACLDALADPDFFFRQALVEACRGHRLVGQLLRLACLVVAERAGIAGQLAAVELDDAGDDPVDEAPVMADHDN